MCGISTIEPSFVADSGRRTTELPFTGLPDPRHSVIKLYGQEVKLVKLGRMPAQILVDKAGIARYVHYGEDMKDILTNAQILALVDALNAEAPTG